MRYGIRGYALHFLLIALGAHAQVLIAFPEHSMVTTIKGAGGRLGDQILFYIGAKIFAQEHGIGYLLQKSEHFDQFVFDDKESYYSVEKELQFDGCEEVTRDMNVDRNKKILYKLPFKMAFWYSNQLLREPYKNKDLLKTLKDLIRPKQPIETANIPENMISVAVHVRKGSGNDLKDSTLYERFPRKFLPDQFYIDQIRRLSDYFNNKKLYVYIFTDSNDTVALKKSYELALADRPHLYFSCNEHVSCKETMVDNGKRKNRHTNAYTHTILNDLFSMIGFDCLIRSSSNFSKVAQIVGEHKVVISAEDAHWDKEREAVVVNKVKCAINDACWCEKMRAIS